MATPPSKNHTEDEYGPNLLALKEAGCLDDDCIALLVESQRGKIERLSEDEIRVLIAAHKRVGPVMCSKLI
jgi:hypothetical protein